MTFKDHLEEFMENWLKKKKKPVGTRILQHHIDIAKAKQEESLKTGLPMGSAGRAILDSHLIPHVIGYDLFMKTEIKFHEN